MLSVLSAHVQGRRSVNAFITPGFSRVVMRQLYYFFLLYWASALLKMVSLQSSVVSKDIEVRTSICETSRFDCMWSAVYCRRVN